MKNITFKFELVDRLTKDGKYPIQLRITQDGKHKRKMSVLRVKSKKDFNKNKCHYGVLSEFFHRPLLLNKS